MKKQWNLFTQQPLVLFHPSLAQFADPRVFLAGVTKFDKELWFWNLDYLVSARMYNTLGSGFPYTPIDDPKLKFDADAGVWLVWAARDSDFVYRVAQPDSQTMTTWGEIQQYVPSLEDLQKRMEAR